MKNGDVGKRIKPSDSVFWGVIFLAAREEKLVFFFSFLFNEQAARRRNNDSWPEL